MDRARAPASNSAVMLTFCHHHRHWWDVGAGNDFICSVALQVEHMQKQTSSPFLSKAGNASLFLTHVAKTWQLGGAQILMAWLKKQMTSSHLQRVQHLCCL